MNKKNKVRTAAGVGVSLLLAGAIPWGMGLLKAGWMEALAGIALGISIACFIGLIGITAFYYFARKETQAIPTVPPTIVESFSALDLSSPAEESFSPAHPRLSINTGHSHTATNGAHPSPTHSLLPSVSSPGRSTPLQRFCAQQLSLNTQLSQGAAAPPSTPTFSSMPSVSSPGLSTPLPRLFRPRILVSSGTASPLQQESRGSLSPQPHKPIGSLASPLSQPRMQGQQFPTMENLLLNPTDPPLRPPSPSLNSEPISPPAAFSLPAPAKPLVSSSSVLSSANGENFSPFTPTITSSR